MIPHSNHYNSVMPPPLLTNQITLSAPQPISVGIAHVVWPQPATTKKNKLCQNRLVFTLICILKLDFKIKFACTPKGHSVVFKNGPFCSSDTNTKLAPFSISQRYFGKTNGMGARKRGNKCFPLVRLTLLNFCLRIYYLPVIEQL